MTTDWTSRCESGNCIETRTVGDLVEVRDTEHPEQVLSVPASAWAEYEAALRAEVLRTAARALLAEAEVYDAKWNRRPRRPATSDWDRGYVAGMQRAAHDVANSIDRPEVLTAVRDETKGTANDANG